MTESPIVAQIRLALGRDPDVVIWRNSTGQTEEYDARRGGARHVRYGLAKGSADLIGIVRCLAGVGRFLSLEVKTPTGRVSPEQSAWLTLVRSRGGYAAVVRSVQDALVAVAAAKSGAP